LLTATVQARPNDAARSSRAAEHPTFRAMPMLAAGRMIVVETFRRGRRSAPRFSSRNQDRHVMNDIRPPTALQCCSFSSPTFRPTRTDFVQRGYPSPNQHRLQAKPTRCGHGPAVHFPESGTSSINLRFKRSAPTVCDPQIPNRSCQRRQRLFLNAVSSLGGFERRPHRALRRPRQRPASETLHHCGQSVRTTEKALGEIK